MCVYSVDYVYFYILYYILLKYNCFQLAEIYKTTQENISMCIKHIYKDGELENNWTNKKFLLVQNEGNNKQ